MGIGRVWRARAGLQTAARRPFRAGIGWTARLKQDALRELGESGAMKNLFVSTEGGKAGAVDGLNLFFGALLGANLGTLEGLSLPEYVKLIVLLAGTVMALRMVSTSERRVYMFVVLGLYALLLVGVALVPELQPKGMRLEDLQRLLATLAVWVAFVLGSELTPVKRAEPPPAP
jgi:hypothetical protein